MAKRKKTNRAAASDIQPFPTTQGQLLEDLRSLIREARGSVAQAVNSALVLLYWQVGHRIRTEILREKRAEYGEQIVPTLSAQLAADFGDGFSRRNLFRMIRFAEVFPNQQVVTTLSRQLSWSHFIEILPLKDDLQRDFYAEMCRVERWSVRTLHAKIGGMLFERTALSKKPAELAKQELAALRKEDKLTPDLVFHDPYFLNFLGLADTYSEEDLELAILRELENFILELGAGFAFVARQKAHGHREQGLLPGFAVLPPHFAAVGGHRVETGVLRGRSQGADGTLPALAGEARSAAGRGGAPGSDPLRR